jgi:lipoprotein-releasing system permease protein
MARSTGKNSWSKPVVRIATAGVSLGIALIILASAVVEGFQHEVRELVVGFGAHVQVLTTDGGATSIRLDDDLEGRLARTSGVQRVQPFYTLPGILETREDHEGVIVKAVGEALDHSLLRRSMLAGTIPTDGDSIVVSGPQSRELGLAIGDAVRLYFVAEEESPRPRKLIVSGIYETGLFEFDREFVFVPVSTVQRAANWGLKASGEIFNGEVQAVGFGTDRGSWSWSSSDADWNQVVSRWKGSGPHRLPSLPAAPFEAAFFEAVEPQRKAPDTLRFFPLGSSWEAQSAGGGARFHASGYEVFLEEFDQLWQSDEAVYQVLPLGWTTKTIVEQSPEMFSWLGMLDLNVEIIIALMVLISIINMASALLIIILERTGMVGLLKALGLTDAAVVKVFVWHATRILGWGFIWGNAIGLGMAWCQMSTGWIELDPAAYYVDSVPIRLNFMRLATVELGAFATCAVMMLIPAWASTRIQPSAALRFK